MSNIIHVNFDKRIADKLAEGEETKILSEKHKIILKERIEKQIKSMSPEDFSKIKEEIPAKLQEISNSKDFIGKLINRTKLLYQILFDENYPKSKSTKAIISGGLLYFISPKDFLPDDIPGLGYLDDAFIIKEIWQKLAGEIINYMKVNGLDENLYL